MKVHLVALFPHYGSRTRPLWKSLATHVFVLETRVYTEDLPAANANVLWHSNFVDLTTLQKVKPWMINVHEVNHNDRPAIAKLVHWNLNWTITKMEKETSIYRKIHVTFGSESSVHFSEFFGHVTENGRVVGMLLEKFEGVHPLFKDLDVCEEAVKQFCKIGMVHMVTYYRDLVVDRKKGIAKLFDFEMAKKYTQHHARRELKRLRIVLSKADDDVEDLSTGPEDVFDDDLDSEEEESASATAE